MATSLEDPIAKLIQEAKAAGTDLSVEGGRLKWTGKAPSPDLIKRLSASKGDLIARLGGGGGAGINFWSDPFHALTNPSQMNKPLTGFEAAMSVPEMFAGELPETEAVANALGLGKFATQHPLLAKGAYKAARTGAAAGAGALTEGVEGAKKGAFAELSTLPFEAVPPVARFMRRTEIPSKYSSRMGNSLAAYFRDWMPETSQALQGEARQFEQSGIGRNPLYTLVKGDKEASAAYGKGLQDIRNKIKQAITDQYQKDMQLPGVNIPIKTYEMQKAVTNNLAKFDSFVGGKAIGGPGAFKNTGKIITGAKARNWMTQAKSLSNLVDNIDHRYSSSIGRDMEALNQKYGFFRTIRAIADTGADLTDAKSGGIDPAKLHRALQDPNVVKKVEGSVGKDMFDKFYSSVGLNPKTGQRAIAGEFRPNAYFSGARPRAILRGTQMPFNPVKNIPGVLNPSQTGNVLGAIGKFLLRGLISPEIYRSTFQDNAK